MAAAAAVSPEIEEMYAKPHKTKMNPAFTHDHVDDNLRGVSPAVEDGIDAPQHDVYHTYPHLAPEQSPEAEDAASSVSGYQPDPTEMSAGGGEDGPPHLPIPDFVQTPPPQMDYQMPYDNVVDPNTKMITTIYLE